MSKDLFQTVDDATRDQAQKLIIQSRFGALGVISPETGAPFVTRIALAAGPDGRPISLISNLSFHTTALRDDPRCSLLIGEPGPKGDPLAYPRLTLLCRATFTNDKEKIKPRYLSTHPKAKLYIEFADFQFVRFEIESAHLNGGYGKAFRLARADFWHDD